MKTLLSLKNRISPKFTAGSLALLMSCFALDCRAATISYTVTDLIDTISGEDLWLYTYRVSDFNFGVGQGFSTTFDSALFTNLQSPPSLVNADWDALTLQPDLLLSSAGLYDAQALRNAPSLADEFKVTAVWLGTGTPGSQSFKIYDSNFATIEQGQTSVILPPQTITFPVLADRTTISPPFNLSATASSGLTVSFSLVSGPATVLGNTVTLNGSVGTVVIRASQPGSAAFAAAAPVDRSFLVTPGNLAPSATAANVSTPEDTPLSVVLTGTDPESNPLTFATVTAPANGTLSGSPPNLTYLPNPNFNGTDSFTFRANDGQLDSAPAAVTITIAPVNDAPVTAALNVATPEDSPVAIVLSGSDVEGAALAYSVVSGPANGILSGTPPNLTYQPNANFNGADSFTYVVNDGQTDSAAATVSLAISATNDLPVADSQNVAAAEDIAVAVVLTGTDADGDSLSYRVVSGPANGMLAGSPPNMTYKAKANFSGADGFTFVVNDGTADSAPAAVNFSISPVNDAPVAKAPKVTTQKNKSVRVVLSATDIEKNRLKYKIVKGPKKGKLTGKAPKFTYTPKLNATGTDSFTFRVNDGKANSRIATVRITIKAGGKTPKRSTDTLLARESEVDDTAREESDDLPLPWILAELGDAPLSGKVSYKAGGFIQAGAGEFAPWKDNLRFTYQSLSGDGGIVAKIASGSDQGATAQAGVMIRESLAANSRHVFIGLNQLGTCRVINRTATGERHSTVNLTRQAGNAWLRLFRRGDAIFAETSADGLSWTTIAEIPVRMANQCYIGLTATDGDSPTLPIFRYNHVRVSP